MRLRLIAGFLCAVLICAGGWGADSSVLSQTLGSLPDGLGVNIHFTDPRTGEMKMIADAGFKWVRMDFVWSGIERQRDKYVFSAYDRLMAVLDEHHIRPIFILDYSNRMYDQDLSPHTDEGRKGFARWAAASALHFKGRGVVWEMYNEPDIQFWRPRPNADDYAKLALAVGKAIHEAAPTEIYIGPACSTMDFRFLEVCFKAGCLEYWAAVSVHPYRQKAPETVAADYRKLREMIDRYAPAGKQIPIVAGEWGYSSAWRNFDPDRQGKFLPRELLANVASGIPISIWYDWHDDGTNPRESEHHFGAVLFPYRKGDDDVYQPKPAYTAMKTLSAQLRDTRFVGRLNTSNDEDWVLLFRGADGVRLAAWTMGQPHEATIPASPGKFGATDHVGRSLPPVAADSAGLRLALSDAPQYLIPQSRNEQLENAARDAK